MMCLICGKLCCWNFSEQRKLVFVLSVFWGSVNDILSIGVEKEQEDVICRLESVFFFFIILTKKTSVASYID